MGKKVVAEVAGKPFERELVVVKCEPTKGNPDGTVGKWRDELAEGDEVLEGANPDSPSSAHAAEQEVYLAKQKGGKGKAAKPEGNAEQIDTSALTVAQLREELESRDVAIPDGSLKADLKELLDAELAK